MYSDDLNQYICEWLIRLAGTSFGSAKAEDYQILTNEQSEETSVEGVEEKENYAAVGQEPINPEVRFSVSAPSVPSVSKDKDHILISSTVPVPSALPAVASVSPPSHLLSDSASSTEFDPFLFTLENIPILYGILDPLNEGSISSDYLREGTNEFNVPWPEVLLPHARLIMRLPST